MSNELQTYPELTQILLKNRGIETAEEAEVFLNPDYEKHQHDPFLMKDMQKAVDRILKAVNEGEKIVIYSDYDMDGIPGAVAFHDFFKKIKYENFSNYIPHRNKEGFGLNTEAIEKFAEEKVRLVITIDCGTGDTKEVELAKKKKIDVIITDHHLPNGSIPKPFAMLNPKQKGCEYPFKELAGAGVVFKLIQALSTHLEVELPSGWEKWLLDMIGMATVGDMVPLKGENRIFAYFGLKVLRKSPRTGLLKLLSKLKIDQTKITEDDIGFMIGPRINAASRMDVPMEAFNLLTTEDDVEADRLAKHLDRINNERKGFVSSIIRDIKKRDFSDDDCKVIVAGNPEWNPGLVGIACSSLVNEYKKPVFVWGRDENSVIKGSCRSCGEINLVELMSNVEDEIFLEFGGHFMSGGFSVSNENIHLLEEKLHTAIKKIAPVRSSVPDAHVTSNGVDKEILIDEVDESFYSQIEKFAPFGEGNPKPIFSFKNILVEDLILFGKAKEHLKLIFKKTNGQRVEAISFFADKDGFLDKVKVGSKINLIANIEKSYFMNRPTLRLRIVDII